jgi:hypothetical protein
MQRVQTVHSAYEPAGRVPLSGAAVSPVATLTIPEAADYACVSRLLVVLAMRQGELRSLSNDGRSYTTRGWVDAWRSHSRVR